MKNKQKIIGSIVILLAFIFFLVVGYFTSHSKNTAKEELTVDSVFVQEKDNKEGNEDKMIRIQIKGAVQKPGVYSLGSGSRIEDLVKVAGGFTADADEDSVVLVKKLLDSDCIVIRKKGEAPSNSSDTSSGNSKENQKIDINTATLEDFDRLPGIGPAKAKIILDYREKNGPFNSIDDLKKVKGIGEATVDKFKDMIEVR